MPIILLSIRYNVCACRSPIYCCLSGTCIQYITSLLLLSTRACISLGWIVNADAGFAGNRRILVQRAVWYEILTPSLIRNTYIRYHICLMRVFIILLSIRYQVCAFHSAIYHYIIVAVVYLVYYLYHSCVRRDCVIIELVSLIGLYAWCVCSSYCCLPVKRVPVIYSGVYIYIYILYNHSAH